MTRSDVAYAYVAYIKARIAASTDEADRAKLISLLNEAYEEMVSDLLSEGVLSG